MIELADAISFLNGIVLTYGIFFLYAIKLTDAISSFVHD